jgi:hypothetical protein
MRGQAMKKVINRLKQKGIDLSRVRALDIFAREGDWQTAAYASKVTSLDAWEIDPKFKKGLKKNIPNARIKIVDSIKEIRKKEHFGKYDLIVVDNPQNCYGAKNEYCEHFNVIPQIAKLLDKEGVIIFNINKQPFGFDDFPGWQTRRAQFYGRKNTGKLTLKFLLGFYKNLFKKSGYSTKLCFNMSRNDWAHNDYLHYLVFSLSKIKK